MAEIVLQAEGLTKVYRSAERELTVLDQPFEGYQQAHSLPRSLHEAIEQMTQSAFARQALGDDFVTGYCAVKALELAHFEREVSAWELRYLLPQV